MAVHEFTLTGDADDAKQTTLDAFAERGFSLAWDDEWTFVATRGSRIKNILFGGFSPYVRVDVALRSWDDDTTVVRFDRRTGGWAGGIAGMKKTRDASADVREHLAEAFDRAGVLVERRDGGR